MAVVVSVAEIAHIPPKNRARKLELLQQVQQAKKSVLAPTK